MKTFFFAFFCSLIFPQIAFAQAIVSEIMYDPEGADGGYEWVEIYNSAETSITLTTWKLLENAVNHRINEFQGGTTIDSGGYAIIADNPANFILAYPGYSGLLFDSAFSLNNTGEGLALVDQNTVTVDSVDYSADPATNGTGASLQYIDNRWQPSIATPGRANVLSEGDDTSGDDTDTSVTNNNNNSITTGATAPVVTAKKPVLEKYFDPFYTGSLELPARVIAGVAATYEVAIVRHAYLKDDTHKNSGYFVWNMGDGAQYTQTWNDPIDHMYEYAGNYTIVLDWYSSVGVFASDPDISFEKTIKVYAPDIGIDGYNDEGAIAVHNATKFAFDISDWKIERNGISFTIPKKTYLPAGEIRYFSSARTGFHYADMMKPVFLSYPNGKVLHTYNPLAPTPLLPSNEEGGEDTANNEQDTIGELPEEIVQREDTESLQNDLLATALFAQEKQETDFFEDIPWWIWLVAGLCIIASALSVILSRRIHSTDNVSVQEQEEDIAKAKEDEIQI